MLMFHQVHELSSAVHDEGRRPDCAGPCGHQPNLAFHQTACASSTCNATWVGWDNVMWTMVGLHRMPCGLLLCSVNQRA